MEHLYRAHSRAVLFTDYADTAYSRLLKQLIPIMRLIICKIYLGKLFIYET